MFASLIGILPVCAGMAFSFVWDTLIGPTIVVSAASFFVVSQVYNSFRK
jgi:ABC-type Mn2+/Zn2+ transport system permease subunit